MHTADDLPPASPGFRPPPPRVETDTEQRAVLRELIALLDRELGSGKGRT